VAGEWFVCAAEARAGESRTKVLGDPAPHPHVRQGVDHLQTGSVSGAARGTAAEQATHDNPNVEVWLDLHTGRTTQRQARQEHLKAADGKVYQ
jgi:hypothetical protein